MVSFLDFSAELILHTLWFLDLPDLLSCQLSHRSLHAIIRGSILLKYLCALKATGMEDNRLCPVGSMSERLRVLNLREDAWAGLLVHSSQSVPVPDDFSLYRPYGPVHGGTCFFEDFNGYISPHYVSLPSRVSNEIHWNHIDVDIITVGLAVYEHDLIAVATGEGEVDQPVEILLLEASTGNPHPLAQNPKISIPPRPRKIKITGNHLALVIHKGIEIYEWKTGVLKMKISTIEHSYSDCLFLSPKVLLLPNERNNTLEFWDIPELPDVELRAFPNGALALPPIKQDLNFTMNISCHGEQFPGSYGPHSPLPFCYPSLADAIALFQIQIRCVQGPLFHFTMFVHHRSLLKFYSTPLSTPSALGESLIGANVIPWDKWGPPVTRISNSDGLWSGLPGANQRCAFINEDAEIAIWDFNPARIQRLNTAIPGRAGGEKEDVLPPSVITNESRLDYDCLQECVTSRLPYAQYTFQPDDIDTFQLVVMDYERLVGIRFEEVDDIVIADLEVFHIGQAVVED